MKISVVINTFNEEKNIKRAINSVKWADEIIVCDMYSTDETVKIAKDLGAKIIMHEKVGFVEPARNFAISKASNEWILILDADEEVSSTLEKALVEVTDKENVVFLEIPRKNIIFNKWIQNSMWWPDYNIRFFRKGRVTWSNSIHRPPKTSGIGEKLEAEEKNAIIHHHYQTISQFVLRMDRYTDIQAKELISSGYVFEWKDLIKNPVNEFLSRYFANSGYKDGLHGLVLGLLQSFSFLVMYLKVWEENKFKEEQLSLKDVKGETSRVAAEVDYWFDFVGSSNSLVSKILKKAKKIGF